MCFDAVNKLIYDGLVLHSSCVPEKLGANKKNYISVKEK
jgi:hypothetical protein